MGLSTFMEGPIRAEQHLPLLGGGSCDPPTRPATSPLSGLAGAEKVGTVLPAAGSLPESTTVE